MNTKRPITDVKARVRAFLCHPATDHAVAGLIIFSIFILGLEYMFPGAVYLQVPATLVMVCFLLELSLRAWVARSKWHHLKVYWVDWLSLAPLLWPSYGLLRALRLLRLFRLGPLMIQSNARIRSAIRQTVGEHLMIVTLIFVTVIGVTLGLSTVEPEYGDVSNSLWWTMLALISAEPMGPAPQTVAGKLFTLVIMASGLTVFALFTGTVSAVMAERLRLGWKMSQMNISELEDHVLVCGWNRSGRTILDEFHAMMEAQERHIVVVAEKPPDLGPYEGHPRLHFLQGDYTTLSVLHQAGVTRASTAILLADRSIPGRSDQDRDARTVLAGLMIEKIHPGIFTCAELLSRENEEHLRLAGIEEVVIGDEYSGTILATSSRVRGVVEIADDIFSARFGNQIYKREVHPDWEGTAFIDLQHRIKDKHEALLLAVERAEESEEEGQPPYRRTETNPPANYVFQKGDRLILLSRKEPHW